MTVTVGRHDGWERVDANVPCRFFGWRGRLGNVVDAAEVTGAGGGIHEATGFLEWDPGGDARCFGTEGDCGWARGASYVSVGEPGVRSLKMVEEWWFGHIASV